MKCDFYTLKYNNIVIATSHSKGDLESLLARLKQNPKQIKDLIQQKGLANEDNIYISTSIISTSR